jgi:hypothetical protein
MKLVWLVPLQSPKSTNMRNQSKQHSRKTSQFGTQDELRASMHSRSARKTPSSAISTGKLQSDARNEFKLQVKKLQPMQSLKALESEIT